VEAALKAGASRAETSEALRQAGWSNEQVDDALKAYADVEFVVPVPRPRAQLSAREAFHYLVTFVALYLSAYHLGSLLFQFVDLAFPDDLVERGEYIHQQIRWSTSALVVAFPLFLYLSYRTSREVVADPARRASAVRRWLVHLTLAVAAFVVLGDLIALVYNLLSGDLTVRFVLKSAIVALIAGSIFGYYVWSVKVDDAALER
jgi:hypothetical protein